MLPPSTFQSDIVYTATSDIHGLGLFAKSLIKKNTLIHSYTGTIMSMKEYKLSGGTYKYCYKMQPIHQVIDGRQFITENPSHYCNESLTPNCALKKKGLYALTDIQPGQECLLHYPKNYPRDYPL